MRSSYYFCFMDIYDDLCVVYEHNEVSYAAVTRYFKHFERGHGWVKDADSSGRPCSEIN